MRNHLAHRYFDTAHSIVAATVTHDLPPPVAGMVQLQLLTGTRPQEVIHLRPCDLTAGDGVWYYAPSVHKTEHLDHRRVIMIGPQARAVLMPRFYCAWAFGKNSCSPLIL